MKLSLRLVELVLSGSLLYGPELGAISHRVFYICALALVFWKYIEKEKESLWGDTDPLDILKYRTSAVI